MNLFAVKNLMRLPLALAVSLTISSSNLFGTSKAQAYHPCPPLHRAEHTGLFGEIPVCVPSPPPINPPTNPTELSEEAWGQAGAVGYQAASDIMRAKNGGSQDLDATQKKYLRHHFGDLVDRVQVIYNAQLMDTWSALGKEVHLGKVESAAQTYCDRIYVRESYKPNDFSQTVLLAHELTHSKQCEKLGGMTQFGYHYFKEYKRGGQNYANNAMEKEAEAFEGQFAGWLSQEIANQNRNPAPDSLASLHSSCSGDPQSSDCVAAIHRACNQRDAGGGISQEVGNGVLGVACFDTKWFGDISIDELRTQHPGCDSTGKSQSSDCVAAIHRACNVRGAGGGIAQEVGNGVLGVACFDTKWFGDISIDELRTQHSGCDSTGKSRSSDCVAAIHQACNVRGAGGGIAQEVGNGVLYVACFDTKWFGDIPIR